jgi:hypothetical protein
MESEKGSYVILLVGGCGFNPSEKYESQWERWHPICEMENKIDVWNHQPAYVDELSGDSILLAIVMC